MLFKANPIITIVGFAGGVADTVTNATVQGIAFLTGDQIGYLTM